MNRCRRRYWQGPICSLPLATHRGSGSPAMAAVGTAMAVPLTYADTRNYCHGRVYCHSAGRPTAMAVTVPLTCGNTGAPPSTATSLPLTATKGEAVPDKRTDKVTAGVTEAWDFWLSQHPISVPELIEKAVRDATTAWLDQHGEDILTERKTAS